MNRLYREFSIWMRVDDRKAVRFRCLEDLQSCLFCVQSADFYTLPINTERHAQFDTQFAELFIEIDPLERCIWYDSVAEAILAHQNEFEPVWQDIVTKEEKSS